MIPNIFFVIVGTIFEAVAFCLSPLSFIILPQFVNSLLYLLGYMSYLGGVIDLKILGLSLSSLVSFEIAFWSYKIVLFLIHLTPWVGNPNHPRVSKK